MTRPAVVVGLGGTGQWALTYLKRELLIAGEGKLPSNIRFLSFDTMPQPEVAVRTAQGEAREELVSVGTVKLSTEEFVHIGGNAYSISDKLSRGEPEYSHIAKWFRNREWRSILPAAAWNLDDGAGRIRQLGRLATFKDMLNLQAGSLVWRSLKRAVDDVKSQGQVSDNQPLELILIGSFAGGTGSGCFLDIALLLRHLARSIPHSLRGYFVLPTAFNSEPTNEMLARSYAAWRELNRFMLVNPDFPIRVDYSSEDTQFQVVLDKRLFDICYLVDGYRSGNPLNTNPKYSIFPSIAEAVATLLDEAGTEYVRTIQANLLPVYQQRRSIPLYSALGSYSFKVPAFYLQQESSHLFALALLGTLLGKQADTNNGRSPVSASADPNMQRGALINLMTASDQNQEKGIGNAGRKEVDGFLASATLRYGETAINPTTFTSKIGYIHKEGGTRNQKLIEDHANAVLNPTRSTKREDPSWLRPFTDLGDDPSMEKLRTEVATELRIDMVQQFGRRQGDVPQQAMRRQEGIKEFVFLHYGGDVSSGEVDGMFGETLAKCQQFHTDLFTQMTRVWTLSTLMGVSTDDAIKARGGKLGYAYDFFDGLNDSLEAARHFMLEVQAQREKNRPRLKLEGLAQSARGIAQTTANSKFFWLFDHPRFEQDLNAFLQTQQRLINLRKEELLHKYVVRTLESLQQIALKARAEIERWIWHLALGDRATSTIGLYDELQRSLEMVQANHGVDRQLSGDPRSERPGIQQLLRDETITQVDRDELQRLLTRLEWSAEMRGDHGEDLVLQATFHPATDGDATQVLINPASARSDQERAYYSDRNRATLVDLSNRTTFRPAAGLHVAQAIMAAYPDPRKLADEVLSRRAEPLVNVTLQDAPKHSAIVRVAHMQSESIRSYFQQLEDQLRAANKVGNQDDTFFIRVINTENPYSCTLVRTDELYQFNRFRAWDECQRGFKDYVFKEGQDPTLTHNFAAEANAARYERQLATSGPARALHPWVVMLLEEETRFKQAIFAILLGLFTPIEQGDGYVWQLRLPLPRGGVREIWLSPNGKEHEVLFQALYNFVIHGQDIRPDYSQLRVWLIRPDEPKLVPLAIARIQEKWGRQQETEEWRKLLDRDDTFLSWLRKSALDLQGNISHPEFDDLATLIKLILEERLGEIGEDSPLDSGDTETNLPPPTKWGYQPNVS